MLTFAPGAGVFAVAGLVAAAGPVIIHLLNRRRYRVTQWAAMEFLLEAVQRNRRILRLRDLALLLLRTAAIALFGLALARPMFSSADSAADDSQPVHAVLAIDNSLSMGYEQLDRTLLGEAKSRAKEFVASLPEGSRVSVLPLAGSSGLAASDAYRTKEDARDALDRIEVVDRSATAAGAIEAGLEARARTPEFKDATRLVFLGDQQAIDWPADGSTFAGQDLPELQVVSIAADAPDNTWIDSFAVQDGLADIETSALLTAIVRHEGPPRDHVQVTLTIDGVDVASETIDLVAGQAREVTFRRRFDLAVEPGKPAFVPAKVSLPPDRLPADDERWLIVPVVAALPVVFVDQYGADEDPKRNRLGETRHLRRLLAPITSRDDAARQLVEIKHVSIDKVDRALLEDARLVVVAGVASPESSVGALRDFVRQGGQLLIVAGGDFDPGAWNQAAWLDGAGILPAPLKPQLFGKTPEESPREARPFSLAFASMTHDLFRLADVSDDELEALYAEPVFFKAAEVDLSPAVIERLAADDAKRIADARAFLAAADERAQRFAELESKGQLSEAARRERDDDQRRRLELEPRWLAWPELRIDEHRDESPEKLAERSRPHALASFDNRLPYLVEREIGAGRVTFMASGMLSPWNTLPKTNAMLMVDRLLRGLLESTLPQRNLGAVGQITLPIADRNLAYSVVRPDGSEQPLSVDALGADAYGVTVHGVLQRGVYTVIATRADTSADAGRAPARLWESAFAVNGPSRESEPAVLDERALQRRLGDALRYRWVGPGDAISVAGARVSGQNLWKWLLGLTLAALLVEMAVIGRSASARERAT